MNLLNLIENTTTGYDNLRALMQASQSGQDAVLNIGGETVTLDPMETRWMFAKYKAFNKAGRQEEFLTHLADPVKFDQHMKQLRQMMDKQKNFRGSVPGQRGVEGDTVPGQVEEDQAVEEIAMQDPNNPSPQTAGKLNWERMIRDYMGNKPYTEFEFGNDRPLTLYRTQVYAILKAFGAMKPQQKVNIILNTFGDKLATVDYLDKLRAKGMMPKKVPAYVPPGTEPVPAGQMDLPGMATPKIREADDQKKNSKTTDLDSAVNPRVARAMQLARARQSAAGNDTEAMVADFVDQQDKDQAEFGKVKSVNQRQDELLKQITAVNQQQDREIDSLDSDNDELQSNLQQLQAVNADLAKKLADVGQRRADRQPEPQAPAQAPSTDTPAEPKVTAEPLQQPTAVSKPAPAKKKKATTRKKSSATKVQRPQQDNTPAEVPDNVYQFPQGGRRGQASDEVAAALQGVDMGDELGTGTFGLRENAETLNVGDPVIITGNVEFNGKTGDVVGFGRDQHFVIVDLYNFGKHAFHASNVEYNNYTDEEDYVDEGRFKELDIERQSMTDFQRKERTAGEEEPVGDFRVVRRKEGTVSDLKQHHSSNKAFAHAQAIKKKYPSMEVGVRWPTGQINWVGIKEDTVDEMQTHLDRYNVNQPTPGGTNKQREKFLDARDRLFRQMQSASPGEKEAIRLKIADLEGQAQSQGIKIRETGEFNRSGHNAIRNVSDWQEKMRTMQELQKDQTLMNDPESRAAIEQRIGDLIRVGQQQGYMNETADNTADLATVQKRIAQLDQLIKMKEMIDRLFVRAQNVRGGIYPGLQSDIEDEELYGVPETDQQYQDLLNKYTKDLAALQKFLAMKKAVYRESEQAVQETSALARLKQARDALSTGTIKESLRSGEYHVATVTLDNGDVRKFKVTFDEGYTDAIKKFYARQGRTVKNIDMDWSIHSNFNEETQDDRNARIIAGEIEDAAAQGNDELVKQKIKELIGVGYTLDKRGELQRMGMYEQGVAEAQTDYQKRRQRERDVDAGKPVARQPKNPQTDYAKKRAKDKRDMDLGEEQDACYRKVKARYKVWPSAYASGALVQCRKKGADNWGTGGKKK